MVCLDVRFQVYILPQLYFSYPCGPVFFLRQSCYVQRQSKTLQTAHYRKTLKVKNHAMHSVTVLWKSVEHWSRRRSWDKRAMSRSCTWNLEFLIQAPRKWIDASAKEQKSQLNLWILCQGKMTKCKFGKWSRASGLDWKAMLRILEERSAWRTSRASLSVWSAVQIFRGRWWEDAKQIWQYGLGARLAQSLCSLWLIRILAWLGSNELTSLSLAVAVMWLIECSTTTEKQSSRYSRCLSPAAKFAYTENGRREFLPETYNAICLFLFVIIMN